MFSTARLSAAITVLLSAFLYYRSGILYTFYANAPGRLQHVNRLTKHEIRFQDVLRNCEDIHINEAEGFALLSCDPGRDEWNTVMGTFVNPMQPPETGIYLYKYAKDGLSAVPIKLEVKPHESGHTEFHPLGLEYHAPSRTIFVSNHLSSGSRVDRYILDVDAASVTLSGSIKDPLIAAPNAMALISGTELLVTNDHYFLAKDHALLSKIETYAGIPGGSIVHVKLKSGGQAELHTLAHLPFANGIVFLNSSTIAVASCAGSLVQLYNIDQSMEGNMVPTLRSSRTIAVPFIPDNLSLDKNGKLLIAGHPHAPSLEEVAKRNRFCNTDDNNTSPECQLSRLSHIAEWDKQNRLQILYAGSEYGTTTTAARDVTRSIGFAVGLYERGLLTWQA